MNFRSILATISLLVLTGAVCAEPLDTPSASNPGFNPFAASYVSRMAPPVVGSESPKLYSGADKVTDYQHMLEDGYDLLGYSSFEAANVPPQKLLDHASGLHAALVLVYASGLDTLEGHAKKLGREFKPSNDPTADNTFYEYFATYWTKLPPPLLGLHVQRSGQGDEDGLEVIAVIKQSPADLSGVQSGDVLSKLGEVALHRPEELVLAAQQYAGQSAELYFSRNGEMLHKTVALNKR